MANNDGGNKNNAKNRCIRIIKFVPILFIMAITAWSYYAYVIEFCYITRNLTDPSTIAFLTFFHLAFVMYSWTYMMTVCTTNTKVPEMFKLPDGEYEILLHAESEEMQNQILENFAKDLPVTNRTINGTVRYCEKCRLFKPDRAHHCSVCGECVLKMDHHCPWVNNCISFSNYKYFILFLFYSLIYSLYVFLTTTPYIISYWENTIQSVSNVHVLFLFFVGVMCAISLVSLFSYHCYLVSFNRTTLEAFRAPIFKDGADKYGYNLGHYRNFKEVFGDNPLLWPFPVGKCKGNGYTFPRRHVPEEQNLLSVSPRSTDIESETWTS